MAPVEHHRCPRYVRGARGIVEAIPGAEPLPHTPQSSHHENVYTIKFDSIELWGERTDVGEPGYDLYIDLYESYLEHA